LADFARQAICRFPRGGVGLAQAEYKKMLRRSEGEAAATQVVITFVTGMRLWSLHPSILDRVGLVALWREGLLAQKVLLGQTNGYRFHPQLERFRASKNPVAAISTYLWAVFDEASARGYNFDVSKIATRRHAVSIPVTQGQLQFEYEHLRRKLRVRDRVRFRMLIASKLIAHPMLRVVAGSIEPWEVV
jgi:hypothetical protein